MNETRRLLDTLKLRFKARGLTYKQAALQLGVSEPTLKRMFSGDSIAVDRLCALAALVDYSLAELVAESQQQGVALQQLSDAQEAQLVGDPRLLLVAVLALNHWRMAEIVATYALSEPECIAKLLQLDRIGLIALLPGNRIRLNIARDFDWRPDGPIRRYFRAEGRPDFLDADFHADSEQMLFVHGMLSEAAALQFKHKLQRLRQDFAELHRESLSLPLAHRRGTGVLLAMREWEPQAFAALRRPEGTA
ncbi:Helix-turn-helix [Andreprevotia lacus DSM 23236]|jgi:transcriptional regulator with XRE-family HTH domain|uniref:Helix-turn-helix n=1 Tax=Andreprevotia lacus DSM 23236 TaxID=1121001 RepID=A0A1W1XRY7_9NEIS|nr:helix-turn-helix transcriptional regulator [Andreprevotia lacus]SMC26657.1 Helix-turn-helix [Andreprevotia lacus DSM 23236]